MKEFIICSAIHYDDGKQYTHQPKNITSGFVVCGRRHHNCITTMGITMANRHDELEAMNDVQGFMTNTDRFVDRREGYFIAKDAGQLLHNMHDESNLQLVSEDLYSEDLY